MSVAAKFKCTAITHHENDVRSVKMQAAIGSGNENWSKFTPSGAIEMVITNPDASRFFEPGKSYHLLFDVADE